MRAAWREAQCGSPPPDESPSQARARRVALELEVKQLRARLEEHYTAQAERLRSGTAGQTQTGYEQRLESLPTQLGALEQRQAAAAAPRRRSPRTLAFDEQPSPVSPADSFTSATEDALPSPEGAAAQAAHALGVDASRYEDAVPRV